MIKFISPDSGKLGFEFTINEIVGSITIIVIKNDWVT
jgi:hypothetical protein